MKTAEGVELIFNRAWTHVCFHFDRNRLSQLMINLLTNAAKFTAKGRSASATDARAAGSVSLRLRHGLRNSAPKGSGRIFDRFVKLNSFKQGTGLGLPICKSIVEHLGGEIGVKSEEGAARPSGSRFPTSPASPCETRAGRSRRFRSKRTN